jgi:membrane protease YdiL (CAAX protease family)
MVTHSANPVKRHALLVFFVLAFGLSWAVEIPLALQAHGLITVPIPWSLHYLAGYGPMLAAIIATAAAGGKEALQALFGRMIKWRVRPFWWLVALAPLVVYALLAAVLHFIQGQWSGFGALGLIEFLPDLGIGALLLWFLTFGLGEETGWRGFALPRLQQGRSALSATVILWVFWALWHLPLFFYLYKVTSIVGFLLGLLAGAVTLTWLYNSTGGSILLVAVWHGAFNFVTGCVACKAGATSAILSAFVMVWAVLLVVWFKPAALSRPDTQVPLGVES